MAVANQSRINLGDLKSQIVKRLGPDRSKLYFSYLNQLLAQKLSKFEFNKLCVLILGRENIPLHNKLIHSVLNNAYTAKTPPPPPSKTTEVVGKKSPQEIDGFSPKAPTPPPPIWSNGDLLPPSPRKSRSCGVRDRRIKDRPSSLRPNGRVDSTEIVVRENGILSPSYLKRPTQNHHHGGPAEQPAKKPRTKNSLGIEVVEEVGELVEQSHDLDLSSRRRIPLQAPLGIPFCSPCAGGARRPLTLASSSRSNSVGRNFDSGELCHSEDLRKRMEEIVRTQGVEGVAVDCANLLNNGLDTYLKRLIKSCVELVGSRSGKESTKHPVYKHPPHGKPVNGVWQGNHIHVQTIEQRNQFQVSLQDFKVAMELNPKQLGEDWPLLLEKICFRSFEE